MTSSKIAIRVAIAIAALHFLAIATVFTILSIRHQQRNLRALLGMMAGLYLLWVISGGLLQWRFGPKFAAWTARRSGHWRLKFFCLCVAMGLLEEAVTTAITNAAPIFGVRVGEVYITASGNYWDVILGHSLVVIAPVFLAWVWLLSRYQFSPSDVLLLFGLTGTLMEMIYGGPAQALQIGMWIFVYGLMVYLPAYAAPPDRGARVPKARHYGLAVFIPFLLMPLALPLVLAFHSIHPSSKNQFPPIVLSH